MNILNKTHIIRILTTLSFIIILALPVSAQEKKDTVFFFKFLSGRNMFYSPFHDNRPELTRLFNCVDKYKDLIKRHEIMIKVNGYSNSRKTEAENLAVAKIRSNRVKSELITRKGLTENCFITRNYAKDGNFVTVSIIMPKDLIRSDDSPGISEKIEHTPTESSEIPENTPDSVIKPEDLGNATENTESSTPVDMTVTSPDSVSGKKQDSNFALKTNLLDYAILMPNIELEWMVARNWSVALEAQGAWYSKKSSHKTYRIASIIPEARFWPIVRGKWHGMYVGVFAGAALYDLQFNIHKNGHEGEAYLGGISAGYMWPISKHLSLDAGLGIGYMRLRDKVYTPLDGHFLYQYTKNINYFGPLRLKLSLVWRISK